ncbi:MAG: hypothetical protein Q7R89_01280 [bacterium]|nr:hypothetical protein [bacterium]
MMQNPKNKIEKALETLKKEFVVVGKTRVRSWHAWLIIGLCVGIVAGILFVANRSGEFEVSRADCFYDGSGYYYCDNYENPVYYENYDAGFNFVTYASMPLIQESVDLSGFSFNTLPQDFNILVGALDSFTAPVFSAFYPAKGPINVSVNLLTNINNVNPGIDDSVKWLKDNDCPRLSAVGVTENQCGLVANAQFLASSNSFPNAPEETKQIIGYDQNNLIVSDDMTDIPKDQADQISSQLDNTTIDLGVNLGNTDVRIDPAQKEKISQAFLNYASKIEMFGRIVEGASVPQENFYIVSEPVYKSYAGSVTAPSKDLGDAFMMTKTGDAIICSCAFDRVRIINTSEGELRINAGVFASFHEETHGLFLKKYGNYEGASGILDYIFGSEARNIWKDGVALNNSGILPFYVPYSLESPAEMLADARAAYILSGGARPLGARDPATPAGQIHDRLINYLLRIGSIKPKVGNSLSFKWNKFIKTANAALSSDDPFLITNMSFGQGMFRLPDVGAINSAADTGLTFLGAINPATGWVAGNVGMSKPGASAHLISEGAYLIRDISKIALKISEFGVLQAKEYVTSGKNVSAQDQAAGAASILVALDDHVRFSKEAEEAIKAYANVPGSKDILDENPRFLKTAFVSAAQLKQKSPSSTEVKNADLKAKMFFTTAQYLSADLSAIATMISYQAAMEQYFNIQTIVAAAYTERAKTLASDTSTIAGNKTLISSAKTNAAASLKTANATYARIKKIAAQKKTAEAKAIAASALSEVNKIKSASASITSATSRASTLVKESTATSNSIKKTVTTLPSLMSDLEVKTANAIYNEAILLSGVRAKIANSIDSANNISSATTETGARTLASKAIKDLNNVSKWLDPNTLKDPNSLAYYHWAVSLGKLISLKNVSVEPVISVGLPNSFKKIDGFVVSSNSDLGVVNKALADIATSILMLQNFEVQIKAL